MSLLPIVSSFRFQSAAPLTPSSPPAGINELLELDDKRQQDCEGLKRKLEVERSTLKRLTKEEKEAECRKEIDPEAEKVFRLSFS